MSHVVCLQTSGLYYAVWLLRVSRWTLVQYALAGGRRPIGGRLLRLPRRLEAGHRSVAGAGGWRLVGSIGWRAGVLAGGSVWMVIWRGWRLDASGGRRLSRVALVGGGTGRSWRGDRMPFG